MVGSDAELSVRDRLIKAALDCFLNDEYHKVTTRQVAAAADTNISMIRYYFGNKEGLYEEMIRETLRPLLEAFDDTELSGANGFADLFRMYYDTMENNPRFPALIVKVLALNQGPGKRFIYQLLERGRSRAHDKIRDLQQRQMLDPGLDPDIVRIAFISLAMMPMLVKSIFEEQRGREIGKEFLDLLARFNGRAISCALAGETVQADTQTEGG